MGTSFPFSICVPNDPVTFGGVLVVLALVAMFTSCVPARKATRIKPMVALRSE